DANLTGPGPDEPASCAGVLAVGGIESDGSLWRYSIQQPYVAVAAPADNIATLDRKGQLHIEGSGTSASCAMVAAAAALIRSRYPSMPWYQVDQRLIDTALPRGNPEPNDGYGYGIIDIYRAVDAAKYPISASAPNPVYAKFKAWLSTPEGRPFATQNHVTGQQAVSGGSRASATGGTSSSPPMIVVTSGCLAIATVVLVLVFRSRSKSRCTRRCAGQPSIASGHAFQAEMRPTPSLGRPPAEPVQAWWPGDPDSSGRPAWHGGPDEESAFK
ncbi:MAG TPA: S8 family serine peptidase, partial [Chloroflexota bacterium]